MELPILPCSLYYVLDSTVKEFLFPLRDCFSFVSLTL
nr:MAG TPA: hypothetical protein [Caudoviricetes sp.]